MWVKFKDNKIGTIMRDKRIDKSTRSSQLRSFSSDQTGFPPVAS
jgi:hypothetical protein